MIGVLCVYHRLSLLQRVSRREGHVLDDSRETPAHTLYDGQNYYPTNKWVLFGHHFRCHLGSGVGGTGASAQFGFLPGLLWLVIGVTIGGAVHDFVILASSVPKARPSRLRRSPH